MKHAPVGILKLSAAAVWAPAQSFEPERHHVQATPDAPQASVAAQQVGGG